MTGTLGSATGSAKSATKSATDSAQSGDGPVSSLMNSDAVERLKEEAQAYLGAQAERLLTGVGRKLGETTGKLNDIAEGNSRASPSWPWTAAARSPRARARCAAPWSSAAPTSRTRSPAP